MRTDAPARVSELLPDETWAQLGRTSDAVLIDVRTRPEWSFVGIPDLSELGRSVILSEWRLFPDMSVNRGFVPTLLDGFDGQIPSKLFFICRSGGRSMEAASAVLAELHARGLSADCVNVAEGFEGDLDANRHRGTKNGWKARGLAWKQS